VDGKEYSQELRVISDPNLPILSELTGVTEEYEVWLGDDEEEESDEEEEEEEEEAERTRRGGEQADG
jgi:hypothetical protein